MGRFGVQWSAVNGEHRCVSDVMVSVSASEVLLRHPLRLRLPQLRAPRVLLLRQARQCYHWDLRVSWKGRTARTGVARVPAGLLDIGVDVDVDHLECGKAWGSLEGPGAFRYRSSHQVFVVNLMIQIL